MANETGLKTLDKLGSDPRVRTIYRDSDGIWCELARGFQNGDDPGCHAIHEDTASHILSARIVSCDCSSCCTVTK